MHPSDAEPIESLWKGRALKKKNLEADWLNVLSVAFKADQSDFSQVATSHGFQLGPREILAAHPRSVVSHSHAITKLLPKTTE